MNENLKELMTQVTTLDDEKRGGLGLIFEIIDEQVAKVTVEDRDELPIFITMADDQLLCICSLFDESQVAAETRMAMFESMLNLNIPMPLSSFAKMDDKYAVFGAMSLNSSAEDVALEITTLSDNSLDAIEALSDYLN
ncbi:MAG: YjfI family protein [Gammaproteobacteria bacterium]|nr:YjfI family protein [Gammaproteobacteria bacterium]MCF6230128.1 YjfI family protein [Gammaproteobacteria bacterium]